jgi:hypothetical protein
MDNESTGYTGAAPGDLYASTFERAPGLVGQPNFKGARTEAALGEAYAQQELLSYGGTGYLQDVHRYRTRANQYPTLTYSQSRCGGGNDALFGMSGQTWDATLNGQVDSFVRAATQTTPEFNRLGFAANGQVTHGYASPFSMTPYNPSTGI